MSSGHLSVDVNVMRRADVHSITPSTISEVLANATVLCQMSTRPVLAVQVVLHTQCIG